MKTRKRLRVAASCWCAPGAWKAHMCCEPCWMLVTMEQLRLQADVITRSRRRTTTLEPWNTVMVEDAVAQCCPQQGQQQGQLQDPRHWDEDRVP